MPRSLPAVSAMLTVAVTLPGLSARADPIVITGGSATAVRETGPNVRGTTHLQGTQGFELQLIAPLDGIGPWQCLPCAPGTSMNIGGFWGFGDGFGTVELNGVSYPIAVDVADVGLRFAGDPVIAPDLAPRAVLSVPFELIIPSALFLSDFGRLPLVRFPLVGRGTATIELTHDPFAPAWAFVQASYEFDPAAPIPEPATLLLLGTGALALAATRYRRRSASSGTAR